MNTGIFLPSIPEQNHLLSLSFDICIIFNLSINLGLDKNFLTDIP